MARVFYFNITYKCNSNCVFCFSNSTGINFDSITKKEIIKRLASVKPTRDDLIVLNGGEPSIHEEFYEILNVLTARFCSKIKIYSNGVAINVDSISEKNGIEFIIPIHGNEKNHDFITRLRDSYKNTLLHIRELQRFGIKYSLKFIINSDMINENFDIVSYLYREKLEPERVYLARMNSTKKSQYNHVEFSDKNCLIHYIDSQIKELSANHYEIVMLDFPFCYLPYFNNQPIIVEEKPMFYFNDKSHNMEERNYYKNIMIGEDCSDCNKTELCLLQKNSYLTLILSRGNLSLDLE